MNAIPFGGKKKGADSRFVEQPVELRQPQELSPLAAVAPEANEDPLQLSDAWWQEHYIATSARAREREAFSTMVDV